MDGDLAGAPEPKQDSAGRLGSVTSVSLVASWTSTPRSWIAQGGPQASGPSGTSISALIGRERRVPTLQGGESPMPDSGSPIVPHDGGRNVAEPSASNAGQRPVSRRQALAYGSSLAVALPPHPLRPRHRRRPPAQHLSVSLAQAKCIVAAAERRARQIGVSMFIVVVDDYGVIEMSSRMDGNSQASVTVVPPKAVPANAFRTPPPRWPRGRRSDPARLDRRSRL